MSIRLLPAWFFLVLLGGAPSMLRADELVTGEGERLHGRVKEETARELVVVTAAGIRRLRPADVVSRIPGEAPAEVLAAARNALAPDADDERRRWLAFAWAHRLDEAAGALAAELVARGVDDDDVRARLPAGHAKAADLWRMARPGDAGDRWGPRRQAARRRAGYAARTDRLRDAGLAWLSSHQDEDGRIDADGFMKHDPEDDRGDGAGGGHHGEPVPCAFDGATTAVATLAWLATGSSEAGGPHAAAIRKARPFLEGVVARGATGFDAIWNHTFALIALADLHRVGRDVALRPVLTRGVAALLAARGRDGGWRYIPGAVSGVPSTAMALCALGACARAGVAVPRDAVERALALMDAGVDAESGRTHYHQGSDRLGYTATSRNTASALAARAWVGAWRPVPHLAKQWKAATGKAPKWSIRFKKLRAPDGTMREFQIGTLDPFAWFQTAWATAAFPSRHKAWVGKLAGALRKGQRSEGSVAGSWDPLGTYSNSAGRAFITGLACLMLSSAHLGLEAS